MADYFSQTVIRPDTPLSAMTALEYAVLGQVFGTEQVGDDIYFSARHGPNDLVTLAVAEAKALLERDEGRAVSPILRERNSANSIQTRRIWKSTCR